MMHSPCGIISLPSAYSKLLKKLINSMKIIDEIINKDRPSKEDLHLVLEKIVHQNSSPVFYLKNGINKIFAPELSHVITELTILANQ